MKSCYWVLFLLSDMALLASCNPGTIHNHADVDPQEEYPLDGYVDADSGGSDSLDGGGDSGKESLCEQLVDPVVITYKENAGTGCTTYPVTAVVPLPAGACWDPSSFGMDVPAQIEALNHWIGRDGSLRHLKVQLQVTVGAGADVSHTLRPAGRQAVPPSPVEVFDRGERLQVNTGPLQFFVHKSRFTIIDELFFDRNTDGAFTPDEQVIAPQGERGGVFVGRSADDTQVDADLGAPLLEIEERGPLRVMIRAEVPAAYNDQDNDGNALEPGEGHRHGYAVRIYAYAGLPFIKIDYQLQNSAKGPALHRPPNRAYYCTPSNHPDFDCGFADPLYFDELRLSFPLSLSSNRRVLIGLGDGTVFAQDIGDGLGLRQTRHDQFAVVDGDGQTQLKTGTTADGFLDVSDPQVGVLVAIRNIWQTWPNGIFAGLEGLRVELFPSWSAQWYERQLNPSGLYWLEDMQHVVKEILLFFHDGNTPEQEMIALSRTFQYPPVPVIPIAWYDKTAATLDLGGVLPLDTFVDSGDRRQPTYSSAAFDISRNSYNFGWDNFLVDIDRKNACANTGGWPDPAHRFFATGQPADYFISEARALGELNVRPQWMANYQHDQDWKSLGLTQAPYSGGNWRGQGDTADYDIAGTGKDACARDDQHGWFYHVESYYWMSANPWVKDWLRFSGEFRKPRLVGWELWPDFSSRGTAHALSQALAAARATDDAEMLRLVSEYVATTLRENQSSTTGIHGDRSGSGGTRTDWAGGAGFLARQVINFMHDVDEAEGEAGLRWSDAFQFLSGLMFWNLNYCNFDYWVLEGEQGSSSGTGLTLVDPQAWYYLNTGFADFWAHLNAYLTTGIPAGEGSMPYGQFNGWVGQWEDRYREHVARHPPLGNPPETITDLAAARNGDQVTIEWTVPTGAVRSLVVWCDRPIVETASADPANCNWWAGKVVPVPNQTAPGTRQHLELVAPTVSHLYLSVFSFDAKNQMSKRSNLAQAW